MSRIAPLLGACVVALLIFGATAPAGVTNPNISVIGQPFMRWNSAPMVEGSRFFLFMTESEILRSRAPLGGQSLNRDMKQEVQCS